MKRVRNKKRPCLELSVQNVGEQENAIVTKASEEILGMSGVSFIETMVLPHMVPVAYVQFISTCKQLHDKYRDNKAKKRQESLVKFMDLSSSSLKAFLTTPGNHVAIRGTKLLNGNYDGLCEFVYLYEGHGVVIKKLIYDNGVAQSGIVYIAELLLYPWVSGFER